MGPNEVKNFVDTQTNCFGFGSITTKAKMKIPAELEAEMGMPPVIKGIMDHYLSQVPPISFKFFVVNKNFFSQVLNFIVRIFATIFCSAHNYIVLRNPLNPEEIIRVNKKDLANQLLENFRQIMAISAIGSALPLICQQVTAAGIIPPKAHAAAFLQGSPSDVKPVAEKALNGLYEFLEKAKVIQTPAQRADSVDLLIKSVKPLMYKIATHANIPGGFSIQDEKAAEAPAPRTTYRSAAAAAAIPRTSQLRTVYSSTPSDAAAYPSAAAYTGGGY